MRNRLIRIAVALGAIGALSLVGDLMVGHGAVAHAADTPQCAAAVTAPHGNAPAQWCSGQELVTLGLGLAVPNKVAQYAQLTVKPWATTNGSEDFAIYRADPANSQVKIFEYARRGVMSGLCASLNNKGTKLVLKTCNYGPKQQFQPGSVSSDGGNSWDSLSNGLAITAPGGAYSKLIMASDAGTTHQGFTYKQ